MDKYNDVGIKMLVERVNYLSKAFNDVTERRIKELGSEEQRWRENSIKSMASNVRRGNRIFATIVIQTILLAIALGFFIASC